MNHAQISSKLLIRVPAIIQIFCLQSSAYIFIRINRVNKLQQQICFHCAHEMKSLWETNEIMRAALLLLWMLEATAAQHAAVVDDDAAAIQCDGRRCSLLRSEAKRCITEVRITGAFLRHPAEPLTAVNIINILQHFLFIGPLVTIYQFFWTG